MSFMASQSTKTWTTRCDWCIPIKQAIIRTAFACHWGTMYVLRHNRMIHLNDSANDNERVLLHKLYTTTWLFHKYTWYHNKHEMESIVALQLWQRRQVGGCTVYPKKNAHGFCFVVLCCGYTLTDFPISIRLISLALWQSKDCPSASKATLMNMDKYLMWIHYERLHNHNKAKYNKTVCIFLGIYCMCFKRVH